MIWFFHLSELNFYFGCNSKVTMKYIKIIIFFLGLVGNSFGQSPGKISYQAGIRDLSGNLLSNSNVGIRMSILQNDINGTTVFAETHNGMTDQFGVISFGIGGGTQEIGSLEHIDWVNGPFFLKREIDIEGGANYGIVGISQFLSVPYAHFADVANNSLKSPDTSSTNEIQKLTVSVLGDTLHISAGNYIIVPGISASNFPPYDNSMNLYGGSGGEVPKFLDQTLDGGYLLVGETFTDTPSGDVSMGSNGESDIWILKLNADGTKEWDNTFGSTGWDFGMAIRQTLDGGSIVVGSASSSDGDVTDGNNGLSDIWIIKLNADGTKEWDKTFGGSSNDFGYDVWPISDGGYIITGSSQSSDGDVTDGNNGGEDAWIFKISSTGIMEWDKTYGGTNSESGFSIQPTPDGGYLIISSTNSSDGDVTDGNNGALDIWVLKLYADGTKEWDKTYGGTQNELSFIKTFQSSLSGGYIIAGSTLSSDGDITDMNHGDNDIWVLKLNSDGTKEWDNLFGGSESDIVSSIQVTSDGGIIVAGSTQSSDGDITDGNNGDSDFWILKLRADGTKEWDKTYGGNSADYSFFIKETFHGGYIIAGRTSSSDGDITDGNNGDSDFWIIKLKSDGTVE